MSTLTVVPEGASPLDLLAVRHRAAWDRTQHGRQEWIEGTLELAAIVLAERKLLPDHREFSRWLERNDLAKINANDRAALLEFAANPVAWREVLEKTDRTSWQHIRVNERPATLTHMSKGRPATPKRKSRTERQIIDKVMSLNGRGFTFDQTAEELGLTKGQVAGIVFRNGNTSNDLTPPPPPRKSTLSEKFLTPEQVDPDFKGTPLEFTTKYGHVLLHTKEQIAETKRQETLMAWIGTLTDHERTARAMLAALANVDPASIAEWIGKPAKAEKLRAWCDSIQLACEAISKLRPTATG